MEKRQDEYVDKLMFSGVLSRDGIYIWWKKRNAMIAGHSRTAVRPL